MLTVPHKSHIMYIMNKMNFSEFGRNGNRVFDAVPLCVTTRGKPFLRVRVYYYASDADVKRLPWSIASQRSVSDWRKFFETHAAQVVTLDGAPVFVVERWADDEQLPPL